MHIPLTDRYPEAAPAVALYDSVDRFDPGRRYATSAADTTSAAPVNDVERQAEVARAMMIADLASAWQSPAVLPRRSEPQPLASAPAATQVPASDEAAAQTAHETYVANLTNAWQHPHARR